MAIALHPGEIHLWEVEPPALTDPRRLDRYAGWLTADERERGQRFLFARHRHAFLIARALVRDTLSRYHPAIAPGEWRFVLGPYGRPELAPELGVGDLGLCFNLSHTDGRAVLALTRGADLGVDVEARDRRGNLGGIADRFFAAAEVADLETLGGDARIARFFDYWTLKEAYIKARGIGVSLGLGRFWFELGDSGAVAIRFAPDFGDEPSAWSFRRLDLGPRHPIALAIRQPPTAPLRIRCERGLTPTLG